MDGNCHRSRKGSQPFERISLQPVAQQDQDSSLIRPGLLSPTCHLSKMTLSLSKWKIHRFSLFPSAWLFFPWKEEINPSSTIKALAKYYFVGLNDRLQCVHNDPLLVISSDLVRESEAAICSPARSQSRCFSSVMDQPTAARMMPFGQGALSEHQALGVFAMTRSASGGFPSAQQVS